MTQPRKSLSTSNLFTDHQIKILKPQTSNPENQIMTSQDGECFCEQCQDLQVNRIKYESKFLLPNPQKRSYYLKNQLSQTHSMDDDLTMQNQTRLSSATSLQINHYRDGGGSFSFSDLDPVEEDSEVANDC